MSPQRQVFVQISDEAFAELKKIVIEEYGDVLSDFEIRDMGSRLLCLFALLATPKEDGGDTC
jgi:hypothetical protein